MIATLRYVLLTALRDRLILALALALLAATAAAAFIAQATLVEQNAFGLAFAGEVDRSVLVLGMITFICFHSRRMIESREIEAILTRPISRTSFVLSYFLGYGMIALLLSLFITLLLAAIFLPSGFGLLEWSASLMLEAIIIVAIAMFCAMSLESPTAAVLAGLGLYLFARMAAGFRFITEHHLDDFHSGLVDRGVEWVVKALSLLVPRLDLFGQSRWLIYGADGNWSLLEAMAQSAVFVPLLLLATARDLQVRRF